MIPVAEPVIGDREVEYVLDAVRSGWVSSLGEYVSRFEEDLAELCGVQHALSVCNGTAALHLALLAAGIGSGDEVVVPSMTFIATANAVRYVGATPIFADCDPAHWCITAEEVDRCLTTRTRAVIPVHLYGHPADVDAIQSVVGEREIVIIEDAAEALGATLRGRPTGSLGGVGVFSFYGNKLITTGEGGALTTDDPELANRAATLRDQAMDPERRYWHSEVAYNYRFTNIQAALGVAQLERFEALLDRKRAIAERYSSEFGDIAGLEVQAESSWARSSWWMTTVLVGDNLPLDRDALAERLRSEGVDTRPAFVPLHELPPYRTGDHLPTTERIGRCGLTLPSAASLSDEDQAFVIDAVIRACR